MDKNAIKKYAVWARRELIERVSQRAMIYGITAKDVGDPNAESVNGHLLSQAEKRQRQALIRNIKTKGYEQVMEEVAYTWFNRFAALRFMEVNGYMPSHIRVFTNDAGEFKPQILSEAIHLELDGLDMNKVYELESANKSEELFKYLLIVQCNALNSILPGMFQRIEDYTELLLPDYLLREGSVIDRLIKDIPEENFDVRSENGNGQIEIIGWLYQYYISEKHEEVVDPLHGKVVKKEEVPAATQLFTTDWVVRYLIDNSVGRYWIERNPNSSLANKLTYFVKPKDGQIKYVDETITPQELSTFDPCVGSGHFLVYAFDVLMEIYKEYGYSEREAAAEIVKNNLYGLDIDARAVQLAYFAIMMKARQYDRRFFSRAIQPHVFEIMESNDVDRSSVDYFCANDVVLKKDIDAILDALTDAKEYGSILQMPRVDFERINARFAQLSDEISMYNSYLLGDFHTMICPVEILRKKYPVVVTNPPYLNKYDAKLKDYINLNYKAYGDDLFSVFMFRNFGFCKTEGYCGFMTPFVWMSIKSYKSLREFVVQNKTITTLIQLEYSAFEEATVPICTFVLQNSEVGSCKGLYFNLSDFPGGMEVQNQKVLAAQNDKDCGYYYEANQRGFERIPSTPITAYWVSDSFANLYSHPLIGSAFSAKEGVGTRKDDVFLKQTWEVSTDKVGRDKRWILTDKAGGYRKWYLGSTYVMDWEDDGRRIKDYRDDKGKLRSRPQNTQYLFLPGISWGKIGSGATSFRYRGEGFGFNDAAPTLFGDNPFPLLAALNTSIYKVLLQIRGGTLNMTCGVVEELPLLGYDSIQMQETLSRIVEENIALSKDDWNAFETSWDFQIHPLIKYNCHLIKEAFQEWEKECDNRFQQLWFNETEINRLFIEQYHLAGEIKPEVDKESVSVSLSDLQRDIRSFISYSVGCMFGRYSLDSMGLIYAGGKWDETRYTTFHPDRDAIIPICDDEYFEDDIVGRFVKFVETVYGKETLEENLRFIADALGGNGSSREVIRGYFINDFYADHLKVYQKRPIYWLFDSGKKNGFKCLIYMHRYQPDTIARIRTDYVHEQQSRYRTAIADLEQRINGASTSERVKLSKQLATLQAQAEEIRVYEEKIHHLADQMIKIDLDDGVKHNYEIFKDVLAKIK